MANDIDNYGPFRNIFDIIENNSQLLPDGDYINLMRSLSQLRLDLKSIRKCSCSGYNFCSNNIDAFVSCSNIDVVLSKSSVLYLLLPLHKRKPSNINFIPNITDIIIDYDFLDFSDEYNQLIDILQNIMELFHTIHHDVSIQVILIVAFFDIISKYYILFILHTTELQYLNFYNMCIIKLNEYINITEDKMKHFNNMFHFKDNVFHIFLEHFQKLKKY